MVLNAFPPAVGPLRRRTGFTLVELLVAMVIGVLLIAFLFQLFNATVKAWRLGENQNDTYREARAALQLMERDISQITAALPRTAYTLPWPPAPGPTPVGILAPALVIDNYPNPIPARQSGDAINQELYCLTTIPNNGISALCAVGYFCVWMPDLIPATDPQYAQKFARAPRAYQLIRQYLGSGYPATPTAAAIPGLYDRLAAVSGAGCLQFTDLYARLTPPLPPAAPSMAATATELCSYIWDLQFRTPVTLSTTTPTIAPSPSPYYGATPILSPASHYASVMPAYIEIRFKALSTGAARQLEGNTSVTRQDWNPAPPTTTIYQTIIQPGTRQFVARVPIYSGSATSVPQ